MGKLHQLLAVEGDLEGTSKKITQEAIQTFKNKPAHFQGWHKHTEAFTEEYETLADEGQELVTTVHKKLNYALGSVGQYVDALLQKERTNQDARADLVVDGVTIGKDLPATFLLGLENRLKNWRTVFDEIPTLPPGKKWELDTTLGPKIYRDKRPEEKFWTKKIVKSQVLVPPSHPKAGEGGQSLPAQVKITEEQVPIGKYVTEKWSGMMSSGEKSAILARYDKLLRSVKKARQKANATEVVNVTTAKEMFNYILGG